MGVKEKLETTQKVANKVLKNAFENNKVSQAFLLNGEKGAPVEEIALFIAQSIVCDQSALACENCIECNRIKDGNYADLIIVDGNKNNIKKDDIENIQNRFSKSGIEEKNKKIYIIYSFENCTKEATNSILKFLEEPEEGIYAILTTNNISKILPTIVSRCQCIRINKNSKMDIINEIVNNYDVGREDATLLCQFFDDIESVKSEIESGEFLTIKDYAVESMCLMANNDDVFLLVQREIAPAVNDKKNIRLYLSFIESFLKDVINVKNNREILFVDQKDDLIRFASKFKNINYMLEKVIDALNNVEYNANIPLLLDGLYYDFMKGE